MSLNPIFMLYLHEKAPHVLLMIEGGSGRLVVENDGTSEEIYAGWDLEKAIQSIQSLLPDTTAAEIRTSFAKWYTGRNSPYTEVRDNARNSRIASRKEEVLSLLITS